MAGAAIRSRYLSIPNRSRPLLGGRCKRLWRTEDELISYGSNVVSVVVGELVEYY